MTRRGLGGVVAALSALLLAGCAVIPTSGAVVQNNPTPAPGGDRAFVSVPNPPADNAGPEDIVRGFVLAASAGGRYAVAKQFLTSAFAASWRPDAGVLVHVDSWTTRLTAPDAVTLTVPIVAAVDGSGAFTARSRSESLPFRLQRVRGQWRIAGGPDGVVLAQRVFTGIFTPVALQFWDARSARFVPDLRWFPSRGPAPVSSVVRALVGGPTGPLRGIATSAFPTGTRLTRVAEATGGLTSVGITTPGAQPDVQTTDRMQQQIAASLQVPTSSVRLTVGGRQAPVAPDAAVYQPPQDPVVLAGQRFGVLSASGVREDSVFGPRIVAQKPTAVTLSARQGIAAMLTPDRQVKVLGRTGAAKTADPRPGLVAPTIDQQGWVYSVPAADPTSLIAVSVSASGAVGKRVSVPGLGGPSVLAIEASTDGQRMLVLTGGDTGPVAAVAGIERAPDGTPTGLTTARYPIPLGLDNALDATWVTPTTIAVLSTGVPVQTVVVSLVGGVSTRFGPLSNAKVIVGATAQNDLRALLESGDLVQRPGSAWQPEFPSSTSVSVLAVQR